MPTLEEITAELDCTVVEERPLIEHRPSRGVIQGYCTKGGKVIVNPIPDIIDTLVHELTHRMHPEWSERTVKRETTKLLRKLTPEDIHRLYQRYLDLSTVSRRALGVQ